MKTLFLPLLAISIALCSCSEQDVPQNAPPQYTITPFAWQTTDPPGVPELVIRTDGRNPWVPQLTVLIGSFGKEQWMLVPYALRRLCREIPDLPERRVSIKSPSTLGNEAASTLAGYSGEEGHQLVFHDNDNKDKPYPLRLGLGATWCNRQQ